MRKADESRKALQRLAVAVFLVVGVMLSFNYAFAAEGTSNTPNTAVENDTQSTDASGSGAAVTESGSGPSEGATAAGDADAVTLTAAAVPTVTISNSSFADSGTYGAVVTGTVPDGARYVWQRSADGENWVDVVATKVTGDSYNVNPDATKATSINIALDSRVIGNNSTDTNLYSYRVQLRDTNGNVLATSDSVENPYYTQLQNGGFESPDCSNKSSVWNQLKNETAGLIWKTTASQGVIEIGNSSGNSSDEHSHAYGSLNSVYGTTAKEGNQFAELNADEAGALYQDVMTVPNSTLYWSLYHKARSKQRVDKVIKDLVGSDTMYVLIMPTSYAQINVTTQDQVDTLVAKVLKDPDSYYKNYGIKVTKITDDTKDWYYHTGDYEVPSGQYLTRYFFAAGATITRNPTVGNFLDGVSFSTHVPDPTPDTGNVTVTKTVTGLPEDSLENYKVTVTLSNTSYSHTFNTWASEDGSITNSYTFTNVPAGTYTVSEKVEGAPDNYTETRTFNPTTATVTVGDRTSDTVEITNAYAKKTGRLTISKKVSGAAANKNEKFTFQLSCDELKGKRFGDVIFDDTGVAKISLSDGQKKDIQGIPADVTIYVKEINLSGNAGTSTKVSNNGTEANLPYQQMDGSDLYSTQAVEVTVGAESSQQLDFTNTVNLEPSTGLGLSTPSMLGLLCAVAAGAAALGIADFRRNRDERKER